MAGNLDRKLRLPRIHFRVLLHAAHMRHGTNGFTSLPKEGVQRIFLPWKIQRLRPGLNPRTWVPKASTLPLDHRSRLLRELVSLNFCNFQDRTDWSFLGVRSDHMIIFVKFTIFLCSCNVLSLISITDPFLLARPDYWSLDWNLMC